MAKSLRTPVLKYIIERLLLKMCSWDWEKTVICISRAPALAPNLYLPALAPNLCLPALAPSLYLTPLVSNLCLPALAPNLCLAALAPNLYLLVLASYFLFTSSGQDFTTTTAATCTITNTTITTTTATNTTRDNNNKRCLRGSKIQIKWPKIRRKSQVLFQ